MSIRKKLKKDKRKYHDMYKGFCRFVSGRIEYKGLIKDRRERFKNITSSVRGSIKLLIDLKHYMAEHP